MRSNTGSDTAYSFSITISYSYKRITYKFCDYRRVSAVQAQMSLGAPLDGDSGHLPKELC